MQHEDEAMAQVGYARVSSVGQRLDVQVAKLQHCDKLFQEHTSGSADKRSHLVACLDYVREGDTLVVTRLDRLARSTWHLCQIAEVLARKWVHLHMLDQSIDTAMRLAVCSFTCWERLHSLRRSSVLSGNARGFRKHRSGESTLAGRRN